MRPDSDCEVFFFPFLLWLPALLLSALNLALSLALGIRPCKAFVVVLPRHADVVPLLVLGQGIAMHRADPCPAVATTCERGRLLAFAAFASFRRPWPCRARRRRGVPLGSSSWESEPDFPAALRVSGAGSSSSVTSVYSEDDSSSASLGRSFPAGILLLEPQQLQDMKHI